MLVLFANRKDVDVTAPQIRLLRRPLKGLRLLQYTFEVSQTISLTPKIVQVVAIVIEQRGIWELPIRSA